MLYGNAQSVMIQFAHRGFFYYECDKGMDK